MPILDYRIPVIDLTNGVRRTGHVRMDTPAWRALNEWVIAHGIDPHTVLARPGIMRDADHCCIRYVEFVRDDDGNRIVDGPIYRQRDAVEQGEAPPFPFPDLVQERLRPMPAVAP